MFIASNNDKYRQTLENRLMQCSNAAELGKLDVSKYIT